MRLQLLSRDSEPPEQARPKGAVRLVQSGVGGSEEEGEGQAVRLTPRTLGAQRGFHQYGQHRRGGTGRRVA